MFTDETNWTVLYVFYIVSQLSWGNATKINFVFCGEGYTDGHSNFSCWVMNSGVHTLKKIYTPLSDGDIFCSNIKMM